MIDEMEIGNIAFNAPQTMNLAETEVIQLLLGVDTPINELKDRIEEAGAKEGAQIRVSDRMEARLSGRSFSIAAVTPEVQAISRASITEWKWEIAPRSKGRHRLHLTLSILVNVAGQSSLRAIRTFDREIEVEVTWAQQAGLFVKNNWQWLWTAVVGPAAIWLWRSKKRSRKRRNE